MTRVLRKKVATLFRQLFHHLRSKNTPTENLILKENENE